MSFKEWKISSTVIEPVEPVGEVFDLKAVVVFFDRSEKKYRKRMHVDTKSDVTIIPLTFAKRLGLELDVKAIDQFTLKNTVKVLRESLLPYHAVLKK